MLVKLVVILISYLASVVAATLTALLILTGASIAQGNTQGLGSALFDMLEIIVPGMALVLVFAAVPFLLSLVVLHVLKWQSWLAHAVAGAVVSLAAYMIFIPQIVADPTALLDIWFIPLAGAVGGFAYWYARQGLMRTMVER